MAPTANALALVLTVAGTLVKGIPPVLLYNRIEKKDVLEGTLRRRVYHHVKRHPGITAGEVADVEGCDRKTAAHHLRMLERHDLVVAQRYGRHRRYYPPGAPERRRPAEGVAADLLRLALTRPGISQTRAAQALGVSRATIQWHARRLRERRLLERRALSVPKSLRDQLLDALAPQRRDT